MTVHPLANPVLSAALHGTRRSEPIPAGINVPAVVSGCVAGVLAGVLGLMVVETVQLGRHHPPITWYTRGLVRRYPSRAFAIGGAVLFGAGMLYSHFVWDAAHNKDPWNPA